MEHTRFLEEEHEFSGGGENERLLQTQEIAHKKRETLQGKTVVSQGSGSETKSNGP